RPGRAWLAHVKKSPDGDGQWIRSAAIKSVYLANEKKGVGIGKIRSKRRSREIVRVDDLSLLQQVQTAVVVNVVSGEESGRKRSVDVPRRREAWNASRNSGGHVRPHAEISAGQPVARVILKEVRPPV